MQCSCAAALKWFTVAMFCITISRIFVGLMCNRDIWKSMCTLVHLYVVAVPPALIWFLISILLILWNLCQLRLASLCCLLNLSGSHLSCSFQSLEPDGRNYDEILNLLENFGCSVKQYLNKSPCEFCVLWFVGGHSFTVFTHHCDSVVSDESECLERQNQS
jgi:hypothetical protein